VTPAGAFMLHGALQQAIATDAKEGVGSATMGLMAIILGLGITHLLAGYGKIGLSADRPR